MDAEDCRKLGQNLTNIYHEKQKLAKVRTRFVKLKKKNMHRPLSAEKI